VLYDQDTGEVLEAGELVIPENYTKTALLLPPDTSYEQWESIGKQLQKAGESVMWWLGDWWAFGDHRYGERAAQAIEEGFPWAYQTCRNAAWVCRNIETSRRRDTLSFNHHAEVAGLPKQTQERLLSEAEKAALQVVDAFLDRRHVARCSPSALDVEQYCDFLTRHGSSLRAHPAPPS